ncbi:MAG: PEP-CTERM sorting domain-containing protein [Gemmatimonadaceae bacterium]
MKTVHRLIMSAAALVALNGSTLSAQVVVNGGAPDGGIGFDIFNDYRSAAAFTVGLGGISFDAIRFWGILPDGPLYSPNIYWEILNDVSGAPSDSPIVAGGNAVATPSDPNDPPLSGFSGFTTWQFDLSVDPQTLGPGIFWLALRDVSSSSYTDSNLLWETTAVTAGGTSFQNESISAGLGWGVQGDQGQGLAFQLGNSANVATAPEPTSIVLLATGLAGLGGVSRRRKRL